MLFFFFFFDKMGYKVIKIKEQLKNYYVGIMFYYNKIIHNIILSVYLTSNFK